MEKKKSKIKVNKVYIESRSIYNISILYFFKKYDRYK